MFGVDENVSSSRAFCQKQLGSTASTKKRESSSSLLKQDSESIEGIYRIQFIDRRLYVEILGHRPMIQQSLDMRL